MTMSDIAQLSAYAKALSIDDLAAYTEKLRFADVVLPDPFAVSHSLWSDSMSSWPPLSFADIFQYFVLSSGLYTMEQSKRITSLEGYNYFACQHVQPVLMHDPGVADWCYMLAKVLPSQRQGQKTTMYETYLIVNKKDGSILTVHCTCMAGYVGTLPIITTLAVCFVCLYIALFLLYFYAMLSFVFCSGMEKPAVMLQLLHSKLRQRSVLEPP
jgi:hypothetical protein